jgi:hypothetical protein
MSVRSPLGATSQNGAFGFSTDALDARAASRSRAGMLGLAGLLVTGFVVSVCAAQTDSLLPESVRPVPSWLAGAFGTNGPDLHVVGAILVLSLMLGCYLVAVQATDHLSARAVLMTIAGLHALVLLAPPLFSTDVFSYQAYARMGALYGANPYLHGPSVISLDPLYPFIGAKWITAPTAYGPVFTILSYLLAPLSIAASALSYKAIAACASIALVAIVWNCARLRGLDPVKASALVGLNPLLVLYGVGGAHNDLLMLAVLMAGVYAMLRHRERSAGGLTLLAIGIKLTAGIYLPVIVAAERRNRVRDRHRDVLIGAATGFALIAVLGFSVFGGGLLNLLSTVRHSQAEGDWHSIPGFISTRLGLPPVGHAAGWLLAAAFVVIACWLVRRVWRGEMDWIDGAAWATVAVLVTASSLLPWYVAWLMPFAALASDRRLWRVALVMTVVVEAIQMLGYIPHGSTFL